MPAPDGGGLMGGQELRQEFAVGQSTTREIRAAAVHVADRIAAEHPHPLDDTMPKLAGRLLAKDPIVAAGILELLDAIGLRPAMGRAS
ncbi:hypothetical protein ABT186_01640 [Streptomyces sp. NPDC001634]|uniref:hypothetical protein n=1 Tax=Streptomyces sp. NPDC001634 TaxID=3154390 RepID=UPI003331A616